MTGLEKVPALLIGATLVLFALVVAMLALYLLALVTRGIEEDNAYRDRKALSELSEDADTR